MTEMVYTAHIAACHDIESLPDLFAVKVVFQALERLLKVENMFAALPVYHVLKGKFLIRVFCETTVVRANNRNLSYLLLVSIQLCFLCSLNFIGYPNGIICRLRQTMFGVTFVLSVSCVLAKTVTVVVAFRLTNPKSRLRRWMGMQLAYIIVTVCTSVQILICVIWTAFSSPFPEQNFSSKPGVIIIECNEGSVVAFWCMLGYMGLLACFCFVIAFMSRHLPDSFNEAKFITFSMVVFISVWLQFIPAYLSTKGKYMVAVEIFALIASSAGLLIGIFFPKCYIILMKPEQNTKEYLRGKGAWHDMNT
ncbi:vomeronasal type-2 receptor 26-like [Protopterus annectens]|uniref:vomeronasal type-2 receptor 26-like n=1 Tax=Protopterus annectens TaxID=7888 RepID=UPI001CFB530F|nr:vomeronasal type-2 receptor 26-like [Protopterus annectens]